MGNLFCCYKDQTMFDEPPDLDGPPARVVSYDNFLRSLEIKDDDDDIVEL